MTYPDRGRGPPELIPPHSIMFKLSSDIHQASLERSFVDFMKEVAKGNAELEVQFRFWLRGEAYYEWAKLKALRCVPGKELERVYS